MVFPMLGIVYYGDTGGSMNARDLIAVNICTLGGTMVGQIVFGIAADRLGRRKMYGEELIITIIGTFGCAMASNGEHGSMYFLGWLCTFRFILGLGMPLCASTIRGELLTAVKASGPTIH